MNGTGSIAPALDRSLFRCTSKCRCGPEELPLVPTRPMTSPAVTCWPSSTNGRCTMWQYLVMMLPACWISTIQPQPPLPG
jgi:hypothetical protein